MNQEAESLLVELYLPDAHIFGACRQVAEHRRLLDVLNHQDSMLELDQVSVSFGKDTEPRSYETLLIAKSEILVAVPRETTQQSRRRAVITNVMGKQETIQQQ